MASKFQDSGNPDRRQEVEGDGVFKDVAAVPVEDLPFPEPARLRAIIRHRRVRAQFFGGDFFADPAWDMLLDLAVAHAEGKRVSVTSLCIASGVPSTTALRWIAQLTAAGLLRRTEDDADRRRAFITLTEQAVEAVTRYFAQKDTAVASPL